MRRTCAGDHRHAPQMVLRDSFEPERCAGRCAKDGERYAKYREMCETNPYHCQHGRCTSSATRAKKVCAAHANHRQCVHMGYRFAAHVVVGSRVGDRCEQLVRVLRARKMACLAAPFLDGFRGYFVTSSWTSFANWASWTRARLGRRTPAFDSVGCRTNESPRPVASAHRLTAE